MTFEEQKPPDIHVFRANERALKVACDHMFWLNSRVSVPMVINVGLDDDISQIQEMLAIKYDGWESNSEEDEIDFYGFKNVITSSP